MPRLIFLFQNHLSLDSPSLKAYEKGDKILFIESRPELTNVPHHKHKLILWLSAQRHFAQELTAQGMAIDYIELTPKTLTENIVDYCQANDISEIITTEPPEWRHLNMIEDWRSGLKIPVHVLADSRHPSRLREFRDWAQTQNDLLMENFYRKMRRQTGLLIENDKPVGGKWNLDHNNRVAFDGDLSQVPRPLTFEPDDITKQVQYLIDQEFPDHMGDSANFNWAVTASDAKRAEDFFIDHCLPYFGTYQDAMVSDQPFMYHSLLSPYLNLGLLDPILLCKRAEQAYYNGSVPLNSAEGFIRQIIGWREYIRGVYWTFMPKYAKANSLNHTQDLPWFYWTGDTKMNCLKQSISQTIDHSYAHHIQRLMITGNFALLAGIDPTQVHEWYLAVYADAFEWVELPNTIGMSQFADGGLLGTKPYVSSGNYINQMSDYCKACSYSIKEKAGKTACPFNYLYWDFMIRHQHKLKGNPRLGYAYNTISKYSADRIEEIQKDAALFLKDLSGKRST